MLSESPEVRISLQLLFFLFLIIIFRFKIKIHFRIWIHILLKSEEKRESCLFINKRRGQRKEVAAHAISHLAKKIYIFKYYFFEVEINIFCGSCSTQITHIGEENNFRLYVRIFIYKWWLKYNRTEDGSKAFGTMVSNK